MEQTQQTLAQLNRLDDLTKIVAQYHCSKCASTQLQVRDLSKRIGLLQHERSQLILKINGYERQINNLKNMLNQERNKLKATNKSQGQYQPHIKVIMQNNASTFVPPRQIQKLQSPVRVSSSSQSTSRANISPVNKYPLQGNLKLVKQMIQNIKEANLDNEIDRNYAFIKLSSDFLEHNSKLSVLTERINYLIRLRQKDRKASLQEKQTIKICRQISKGSSINPKHQLSQQSREKTDAPLKHNPSSINILEFDSQNS